MEHYNKLSAMKSWKKLMWVLTGCCGAYCAVLFLQALLQELPENAARMNEWNLPYYILFVGMLLHSISLSVIYKTLREMGGSTS
ncbi:hypothetical protein [uncultured Oscillibacter sp.]|uniref:hypothetical protein n=1 Tax=uncultured Oscillibacter sp. TaxID=876091 RepID=UPI002616A5FC|nr:hypothetical protein [uncultured Oscillibacter sp.]